MLDTSTTNEDWLALHRVSEDLASKAQMSALNGDAQTSKNLYKEAASAELKALSLIAAGVSRTRGILAVSAVACLVKGGDQERAQAIAQQLIASNELPDFALIQLRAFNPISA